MLIRLTAKDANDTYDVLVETSCIAAVYRTPAATMTTVRLTDGLILKVIEDVRTVANLSMKEVVW